MAVLTVIRPPPTTQGGEILSEDQTMAGEAPSMEGNKTGLPDPKTLLFKPPPATHELCCYMLLILYLACKAPF